MALFFFLLFQGNPGNGGGLPACSTPNPPWWCEGGHEPPAATIDAYIPLVLTAVLIFTLAYLVIRAYVYKDEKQKEQLSLKNKQFKHIKDKGVNGYPGKCICNGSGFIETDIEGVYRRCVCTINKTSIKQTIN